MYYHRSEVRPEIPDKLVFRIGDVAEITGVKPHVLRYWETEFPSIAPKKGSSGQRIYRRKDVELILDIRELLWERRFTIEGARNEIESRRKQFDAPKPEVTPLDVTEIRRELLSILEILG